MAQMDPVASQHSKSPLVDTRMMAFALLLPVFPGAQGCQRLAFVLVKKVDAALSMDNSWKAVDKWVFQSHLYSC